MIIKKIEVRNFGPFYSHSSIEFNTEHKGIHIIRGGNGQGKTSLLRAIIWAFYGKVVDRNGKNIRPSSFLNFNAYEEGIYDFYVKIWFNHDGEDWTISRRMSSKTHHDSAYYENMKLDIIKNGKLLPNPQNEIERLLPYHVSRFYFFDGEMLGDYEALLEQDESSAKFLRDSIEHVLGLPYLKLGKEDLTYISRQFTKERNRLLKKIGNKGLEDITREIQFNEDNLEESEKAKKNLQEQKENLASDIFAKKREQKDFEDIKELAQTRLDFESKIKLLESNRERFLNELQISVSSLYRTLLIPIAENVLSQFEAKYRTIEEDYDKKRYLEQQITELEKNKTKQRCSYCGSIINIDNLKDIEKNIYETRTKLEILGDVPKPPAELDFYKIIFNKISTDATDRNKIILINNNIRDIDYEIAMLSNKLADIGSKLIGIDSERPKKLEKEIQALERELGRVEGQELKANQEYADLLKTKGELTRILHGIPITELKDLEGYIYNVSNLEQIFESAISEYRDAKRNDIEKIASGIFVRLRSKEEFDHLKIDDRYGLSIITKSGRKLNRAEWRSSGEEHIVALALIGALNKSAQINAPVFMDTTLGRFDMNQGERVLKFLPNLADQIVVLVTDREFRSGDERFLEGKIRDDFTLKSLGEKEGSVIRPTL